MTTKTTLTSGLAFCAVFAVSAVQAMPIAYVPDNGRAIHVQATAAEAETMLEDLKARIAAAKAAGEDPASLEAEAGNVKAALAALRESEAAAQKAADEAAAAQKAADEAAAAQKAADEAAAAQ
ncbi:MAG: hypothetical protein WAT78_00835, partial [Rhizobiaceae bacterium]